MGSGYKRRRASEVRIGKTVIGGNHPVAPQSMTNCPTLDTEECVRQIARLHAAGCNIVRLTVQGRREAANLKNIRELVGQSGLGGVALVADVHFAPELAVLAAEYVDKVRINPGNYGDPEVNFPLLIEKCRSRGVAVRIGVNHGSLAPHMVERWGDTPRGMVESAMEYLRICRREGFDQVVVSMKSSNVRVMVQAYRLLVHEMDIEGMSYPLHLGVTEAGNGAEGRIKSASGIGALMADGLGDTIRVSLTEPPENEIPVADVLIKYFEESGLDVDPGTTSGKEQAGASLSYPLCEYSRRHTEAVGNIGGGNPPALYSELDAEALAGIKSGRVVLLSSASGNPAAKWRSLVSDMTAVGDARPVMLHKTYNEHSIGDLRIKAAADFAMPLIDGLADGIWIGNSDSAIGTEELDELALAIFQAARVRMSNTEYIACPGCGRTLYNIERTLDDVKARTLHLKHLKIGVMGCIVNGPGEMADADYGYVGEGRGRITLYKGREVVRRSIPESDAIDALVSVIKENGDWTDR